MASATGERTKQVQFSRDVDATNTAEAMTTKDVASRAVMVPRGSSRPEVRGFSASNLASTRRLNPIAALRAETIVTRIQPTLPHSTGARRDARSAPASAKGRAKTVWLKRTNDR